MWLYVYLICYFYISWKMNVGHLLVFERYFYAVVILYRLSSTKNLNSVVANST